MSITRTITPAIYHGQIGTVIEYSNGHMTWHESPASHGDNAASDWGISVDFTEVQEVSLMSKFGCNECDHETPIWDLCPMCTDSLEDNHLYCARCTVAPHANDDIYCAYCRAFLAQESRMIDAFIAMRAEG